MASERSLLPWFRCLESCISSAAAQSPFQSQTTAAALGQLKMQGATFIPASCFALADLAPNAASARGWEGSTGLVWGRRMRCRVSSLFQVRGRSITSVSVSSPAVCLAPVYLEQQSRSPSVLLRAIARSQKISSQGGLAYAPRKDTTQLTACVSLRWASPTTPGSPWGSG